MPEAPASTAAGLSDLVARNLARFEQAAGAHAETVADLEVVGRPVRLRVVGAPLTAVMVGALGHLAVPGRPRTPELTICAWDEASTGVAAERDETADIDDAPTARTVVSTGEGLVVHYGDGSRVLQGFDAARSTIFLWASDVDALARTGDRTKPVLEGLHAWLLETPWQPVHAGAVGGPSGGVLLAGPAGAGKSTTALTCLRAGWRYAGDDYVAVRSQPDARVEPLYRSARITLETAAHFPEHDAGRVGTVTFDGLTKHDIHLADQVPAELFAGFPLRALLLPRVVGGETRLHPAPRAAAMIGLSTTTLYQLRGGTATAFGKIGAFVESLPAYWLDLGEDIDAIPAAITAATGVGPT